MSYRIRLVAVVAVSIVVIGAYSVLAVAQNSSRPVSRLEASKAVDAAGLGATEAVTSEELDQTNASDPTNGSLAILPLEARGVDLSLKPLNTAPANVRIRIPSTAVSIAN